MKVTVILVSFFLLACSNEKTEETPTAVDTSIENTVTEEATEVAAVNSHDNWDGFFADFYEAVKAGDKEKIKAMSSEKHLEENFFSLDEYTWSFEDKAKENFLLHNASNAVTMESGPKEELENQGVTNLLEYIVHDKKREFTIAYYFGKVNGDYKLVHVLMAG